MHGVDIYERLFNSLFSASVVGSSEESIFLVQTPNYLILFLDMQNMKLYLVGTIF